MYKVIRCGSGFDPILVQSLHETPTRYYTNGTYPQPTAFDEISESHATNYFSGIADGMGFEIVPEDEFPTLENVLHWVTTKRKEAFEACLKKEGITREEYYRREEEALDQIMRERGLDPNDVRRKVKAWTEEGVSVEERTKRIGVAFQKRSLD